jgi:hypothetical protein
MKLTYMQCILEEHIKDVIEKLDFGALWSFYFRFALMLCRHLRRRLVACQAKCHDGKASKNGGNYLQFWRQFRYGYIQLLMMENPSCRNL